MVGKADIRCLKIVLRKHPDDLYHLGSVLYDEFENFDDPDPELGAFLVGDCGCRLTLLVGDLAPLWPLASSPSMTGSRLMTGRLGRSPWAAAASHQPPSSIETPSTCTSQPHCLAEYLHEEAEVCEM